VLTVPAPAWALHRLYPRQWQVERFDRLLGHRATWEGLKAGKPWRQLEADWRAALERFVELRRKYLLYAE
jgi:Protein of unknown function (DUF1343)